MARLLRDWSGILANVQRTNPAAWARYQQSVVDAAHERSIRATLRAVQARLPERMRQRGFDFLPGGFNRIRDLPGTWEQKAARVFATAERSIVTRATRRRGAWLTGVSPILTLVTGGLALPALLAASADIISTVVQARRRRL